MSHARSALPLGPVSQCNKDFFDFAVTHGTFSARTDAIATSPVPRPGEDDSEEDSDVEDDEEDEEDEEDEDAADSAFVCLACLAAAR